MLTPLNPKTFPLLKPRQNASLVSHGANLFNLCPFPDSPALYVQKLFPISPPPKKGSSPPKKGSSPPKTPPTPPFAGQDLTPPFAGQTLPVATLLPAHSSLLGTPALGLQSSVSLRSWRSCSTHCRPSSSSSAVFHLS